MHVEIRRAIHEDMDWITDELREFSKYFDSKHSLFGDEAYVRQAFMNLIDNQIVLMACNEKERMGFIAGMFAPHMFNPKITVLYELFWWVSEKYRRSRAGLLLLKAFTALGKKNAHWVIMTLEERTPVSDRSLLKYGYHRKERNFILEV